VIHKGRVLLEGEPGATVARLQGRIWRRVVDRDELGSLQSSLPIVSSRLQAGRTVVRAYSENAPGPGFEPVAPELEDVYFSAVAGRLEPARAAAEA
jgi:hypothetical protein